MLRGMVCGIARGVIKRGVLYVVLRGVMHSVYDVWDDVWHDVRRAGEFANVARSTSQHGKRVAWQQQGH
eukprot:11192033-Lingulodinium_polyedra.AAC.1